MPMFQIVKIGVSLVAFLLEFSNDFLRPQLQLQVHYGDVYRGVALLLLAY